MTEMAPDAPAVAPAIAVIGLAGRFPGARDVGELWRNLCGGVESIRRLSREEMLAAGVDPAALDDPRWVPAGGVLDGSGLFDAAFFQITPREAELLDPQHRIFLECAWEALEDAGCDPARFSGAIGAFAGSGLNTYLLHNLIPGGESAFNPQVAIANDKDFLTTRLSYKLDLKGPSLDVQTGCSTSLVTVVLACQSLLNFQCDLALAGGVAVREPQSSGYLHQENGILSPDGHCRPFDAQAGGTVPGNGVGVVALKRLEDALADGDAIRAVILGAALNNDGSSKVGFTAPGVAGQAEVVATALAVAGVEPGDVSLIEAHGTATPLGDPIEVRALDRVFRTEGFRPGSCALGSLKSNLGHLDAAAGVAGLIKTVLALEHRQIPPTLHFTSPHPEAGLEGGPFYVPAELRPWETDALPRRAGVSSFGIGGTNAHVILEEAPSRPAAKAVDGAELLILSARTESALEATTARLSQHLEAQPEIPLRDVAHTLRLGRRQMEVRRAVVVRDQGDAVAALADPQRVLTALIADIPKGDVRVAFLFPGQGAQHEGMAAGLYEREPAFRKAMDACRESGPPWPLPYPDTTETVQPALFAVEYALAKLWQSWGVKPAAFLGHSLGEYVAACLAGVFPLATAMRLVTLRGQLMQSLPPGAMLSVSLSEDDFRPLLGEAEIAAVNAPDRCVATGSPEAIERLRQTLAERGIEARPLPVERAFHSRDVEPILATFMEEVRRARPAAPEIPWISNVTGTWITAEQATDPAYWGEHLRRTVRFADGVRELTNEPGWVLLEVGPGQTLTSLARRNLTPRPPLPSHSPRPGEGAPPPSPEDESFAQDRGTGATSRAGGGAPSPGWGECDGRGGQGVRSIPSLPARNDATPPRETLLGALGRLWLAGVEIDWSGLRPAGRRAHLPTYPFERQRFWIEPKRQTGSAAEATPAGPHLRTPLWRQALAAPPRRLAADGAVWLVFSDGGGITAQLLERLQAERLEPVAVTAGAGFSRITTGAFSIDPGSAADINALLDAVLPPGRPLRIIHLSDTGLDQLAAALLRRTSATIRLDVIVTGLLEPAGSPPADPALLGICRGLEAAGVSCRLVDVIPPASSQREMRRLIDQLHAEIAAPVGSETVIAWRGRQRWVEVWEELPAAPAPSVDRSRSEGVWLISGEPEEPGHDLAHLLAARPGARVTVLGKDDGRWDGLDGWMSEIAGRVTAEVPAGGAGLVAEATDALCTTYVVAALRSRGIEPSAGSCLSIDEIRRRLGLASGQERLFQALLRMLRDDGLIEVQGEEIRFLRDFSEVASPAEARRAGEARAPQLRGLFDLLDHCGGQLAAVLAGEIPGLSVLYPEGSSDALARAIQAAESEGPRDVAPLLLRDLLRVVQERSPGRPLRILEVGGGQGTLTREILPVLGAGVEYWFTDVGRSFVVAAEGKWAAPPPDPHPLAPSPTTPPALPGRGGILLRNSEESGQGGGAPLPGRVRGGAGEGSGVRVFTLLDITRDPTTQNLPLGTFDAILGANVVHATPSIEETLRNLRSLLAPGGLLALMETVRRQRWADLVWGLTEGWWSFADAPLRTESPLLGPEAWEDVLGRAGFEGVRAWPRGEEDLETALLLGRADGVMERGNGAPRGVVYLTRNPAAHPALAARADEHVQRTDGFATALLREEGASVDDLALALDRAMEAGLIQVAVSRRAPLAAQSTMPLSEPAAISQAPVSEAEAHHGRPRLMTAYVAPRTDEERAVAEIWQRALGIGRIGVHDNFLELGGDSLVGLQVIHAVRERFGLAGPGLSLYEHSTVAALASFVTGSGLPVGADFDVEANPAADPFELRSSRGERRRERRGSLKRTNR
jgi:acyl transferase domain-containing protein/SAM-dependent methyltransferase/acyl carrier protein